METTESTNEKKPRKVREGCEWKNLEVSEDAVKLIAKEAIDKGFGHFKPYAEHLLEEHAKKIVKKQK